MGVSKRFRVTITTVYGRNLHYTVSTPVAARRAVAVTAKVHQERMPEDPLLKFIRLESLPGTAADAGDIIDTTE